MGLVCYHGVYAGIGGKGGKDCLWDMESGDVAFIHGTADGQLGVPWGGGVARQLKIFVSQDGCWGGSGHILGKLAWGLLGLFSCVRKIGWDMDGRGNGGALRLA